MNKNRASFFLLFFCFISHLTACSVLTSFQPIDPQSATLTALITPTSVQPTLDLKGNEVLNNPSCLLFESALISQFPGTEDGGIFRWADKKNMLAFVIPENRYWAWFSGDAMIVDFENINEGEIKQMFTSGIKVFGDFAFSPDASKIAFAALRPSDKVYTIMAATLRSKLQSAIDLFPGLTANTDPYSSEKSVIGWENENEVTVSTSCGIDCEQIYKINTLSNAKQLVNEVRKKEHSGREFPQIIQTVDARLYPAMLKQSWSPRKTYVFYTDEHDKVWILTDKDKKQFQLPISGKTVIQTAWSADETLIAIRYDEKIEVHKIHCID